MVPVLVVVLSRMLLMFEIMARMEESVLLVKMVRTDDAVDGHFWPYHFLVGARIQLGQFGGK